MAGAMLAAGFFFARRSGSDFTAYSNDFNVYYFAAREILSGRDPYQNRLGPWTPYLYPPVLAELIAPLALLPLPLAAYIWFIIGGTSILLAAHLASTLSRPLLPGGPPKHSTEESLAHPYYQAVVAIVALLVVGRFALDCFAMGQVNVIVASLAVAHVYLYSRGRPRLAAIALALGASIKLIPAILIIYHLAKGRIRFAIATSLLLATLLAASFLVFGRGAPAAFTTFRQETIANGQGFDLGYSGNQSIRAAELRFADQPDEARRNPYDPDSLVISVVVLLGALFAAATRKVEIAAVAPIFCCMVVLSPLAWKAHFVALLLPAAYLAARAIASPRSASRRFAGLAVAAAFVLFTLTSPTLVGARAAEWADRHSLVLLGALIIYLASFV